MLNTNIENKDLTVSQLPLEENDFYEFKSSLIEQNKLKDALQKAASGFANSGGGYFIVGIDDKTGLVDGGIKKTIGKRSILDWVDNIINQVEPVPKYSSRIIDDIESKGMLNADCVVLSVYIFSSNEGPHMAPDCHYYIRAGKHTVPARHFIVEAIRLRRFDDKPKLTYALRLKQSYEHVLQLGIVSLSKSPAINVSISLNPLPKLLQKRSDDFPIKIPFIDQNNPFYFDVSMYFDANESFGKDVILSVIYSDVQNYKYEENFLVGLESTPPIVIGNRDKKFLEIFKEIEKSINTISKAIQSNY